MTPNGFPRGPPIPRVATTDLWLRRPFDLLDFRARRHGEPFSIDLLGLRRIVVVVTPDAVKHVFADDGDTSAAGRFDRSLARLLGDKSVLMLDGAEHKRHRKLLLPLFHGERMPRYGEAMMRATDHAIDRRKVGFPFGGARSPVHRRGLRDARDEDRPRADHPARGPRIAPENIADPRAAPVHHTHADRRTSRQLRALALLNGSCIEKDTATSRGSMYPAIRGATSRVGSH